MSDRQITKKKLKKFLSSDLGVFFGALICCGLWGSAFPAVKIGMQELGITSAMIPTQILFAGCRFTCAGIAVVLIGSIMHHKPLYPKKSEFKKLGILALFQTVGQYMPYYIGIAHTSGVNTSIVDSLSYFFSIVVACLIFRLEKITWKKFMGCALGFAGVILISVDWGASLSFNMSFIGEGMILLSALSYSFSSVFAKIFSRDSNPVMLSGWQFFFGGLVIIAIGLLSGGHFDPWSGKAIAIFIYQVFISTCAYTLWTILLKYNDVSKVSIYGFLNPVFGVLLSALFLGESQGFQLKYLLALVGISIGISLVNLKSKSKTHANEMRKENQ